MINPFERFYDTELSVYSYKKGGYGEGAVKTLLGTVVCDLQPMTDDTESRIYGLSNDRYYKIYSDKSPLIKDGNLVLFASAWYRIIRTEEWSFGVSAVMRSVHNEA